jgi:hypothetical protein
VKFEKTEKYKSASGETQNEKALRVIEWVISDGILLQAGLPPLKEGDRGDFPTVGFTRRFSASDAGIKATQQISPNLPLPKGGTGCRKVMSMRASPYIPLFYHLHEYAMTQ